MLVMTARLSPNQRTVGRRLSMRYPSAREAAKTGETLLPSFTGTRTSTPAPVRARQPIRRARKR